MHIGVLVSTDVRWAAGLATQWIVGGDEVTVVLLDAAAAAARRGHAESGTVAELLRGGAVVAAQADALRRRAIRSDQRVEGVKVVDLDEVADLVADGTDKVMWL